MSVCLQNRWHTRAAPVALASLSVGPRWYLSCCRLFWLSDNDEKKCFRRPSSFFRWIIVFASFGCRYRVIRPLPSTPQPAAAAARRRRRRTSCLLPWVCRADDLVPWFRRFAPIRHVRCLRWKLCETKSVATRALSPVSVTLRIFVIIVCVIMRFGPATVANSRLSKSSTI